MEEIMTLEEYENNMTEEEREAMYRQQYLHQLDMLRSVNTFLLMGYGSDIKSIYEGMRALHYICSEDQIQFYCEYIGSHSGTIMEINDALWTFLWEIPVPKTEEEEPGEEPKHKRRSMQSYLCRIVVLNLLVDRIDYLRSVLKAGRFEMTHFINAGYDTCYVETMKKIIEENPEAHSRDVARKVYQILYRESKHMDGFIYSIDKLDFWGMIHTCRDKWQPQENSTKRRSVVNKNSDYYAPPNPYKNAPSCGIDLLALSRYARRQGKKLRELTEEEIDRFRIRKEDVNENRKNR